MLRSRQTRGASLRRDERGFTLPELLVTMMVMIVVLFALYNIFDASIRVFSFGNNKVEAVENARIGLESMERDIRGAYPYNKAGGNATLLSSFSPNKITFGNDRNGNRIVDIPGEQVTYELSGGSPPTLLRNSEPTVEFVKSDGLTFEYLKRDGSSAGGTEADISIVRVKLSVEIPRGSQPPVSQELTTDIALRNRGE